MARLVFSVAPSADFRPKMVTICPASNAILLFQGIALIGEVTCDVRLCVLFQFLAALTSHQHPIMSVLSSDAGEVGGVRGERAENTEYRIPKQLELRS